MPALAEHGAVLAEEMLPALAHAAQAIPLRRRSGEIRAFAMVDAEDFERVAAHRWYMNSGGYVVRQVTVGRKKQRTLGLHRFIMGLEYGDPREVDHRDGNPLDNRRSNLRVCTHALNGENKRPACGRSAYRGVSWSEERQRWVANGCLNYRQVYIGAFDTEQEAADAAAAWRKQHMPFSTN